MKPHLDAVHAERRARVCSLLRAAGGGVAVVPTAPERSRNADNEHPYRHDSAFYYLTGFSEPGAWLVLEASGTKPVQQAAVAVLAWRILTMHKSASMLTRQSRLH